MSTFGKRLIVIMLLAVMVIGIIFVGNNANILDEETQKNAYYQTETVYFWYTDSNFTDFFTSAAVSFHELNPDIRVIPVLVSASEYLEKINEASLGNDNLPDVYLISNDALERAYLSGLASKVKDTKQVLNNDHFSSSALDAVTYRNGYVGYPFSFETSVLLYNKTLLQNWVDRVNSGEDTSSGEGISREDMDMSEEEISSIGDDSADAALNETTEELTVESLIPKSFMDIIDFADTYSPEAGVEGVLKWDVSDIFYNYLFVGYYMLVGGNSGDDTSLIDICNLDTLNCVTVYQKLNQVFSIDAKTSDYSKVLDDFIDGKLIFTIATSDAIEKLSKATEDKKAAIAEAQKRRDEEALASDNVVDESLDSAKPSDSSESEESEESEETNEEKPLTDENGKVLVDYEYGYALIPDVTADLKSKSLSVTDTLVINGYSEHKEAADRFAAYLSTSMAPSLFAKTGRLAAAFDAGYEDEACDTFQQEYSHSIPLPKIVEASNLWVHLEIAFTDIWSGSDYDARLHAFEDQIKSQLITE